MKNKNEYLKKFINMTISQRNLAELTHNLPSLFADVILDKKMIHPNIELKPFADRIGNQEYREYLFASRTALLARLIKDRFANNKNTVQDLQNLQLIFAEMLTWDQNSTKDAKEHQKKPAQKSKTKESALKQWRRIIEQG